MKIHTRFIYNYSTLTTLLLLVFSTIVLFFYVEYRFTDFNNRLSYRTSTSVNMLLKEQSIDSTMLRLIDRNIITSMSEFTLYVRRGDTLVYSNTNITEVIRQVDASRYSISMVNYFTNGESYVDYALAYGEREYHIYSHAIDTYGITEFRSMLRILAWVICLSLVLIVSFGFYNARWSLQPFKIMISEVEAIGPRDLNKRLPEGSNDEISQLSRSFNALLNRIETAFETEKSFISNASHELRTPVTSVLGQIEVALKKERTCDEYKDTLRSVYDDTSQMATIINGFLQLAEANLDHAKIPMEMVEVDELIFRIVSDFERRKPHYTVLVEYAGENLNGEQLCCKGNTRLLQLMFNNLVDNACKYSADNRAKVKLDSTSQHVVVQVTDYGLGIANHEIDKICKPMFRGSNSTGKPGHGIGLAIVKRVADIHNADLSIDSVVNIGTVVTVKLAHEE